MASSDVRAFLAGGLSALLDGGGSSAATPEQQAFPEQSPPQDEQTRDNANPDFAVFGVQLSPVTLLITAIAVIGIGVVAFRGR